LASNERAILSLTKSDIVYWLRFCLAIISALLSAFLRLGIEGLAVGAVIYFISYILARFVIKTNIDLGRYGLYILGLVTYLATWFTLWIYYILF